MQHCSESCVYVLLNGAYRGKRDFTSNTAFQANPLHSPHFVHTFLQEKAIFDKNSASFPFKLEVDEKDAFKWTIAFTAPVRIVLIIRTRTSYFFTSEEKQKPNPSPSLSSAHIYCLRCFSAISLGRPRAACLSRLVPPVSDESTRR